MSSVALEWLEPTATKKAWQNVLVLDLIPYEPPTISRPLINSKNINYLHSIQVFNIVHNRPSFPCTPKVYTVREPCYINFLLSIPGYANALDQIILTRVRKYVARMTTAFSPPASAWWYLAGSRGQQPMTAVALL